MSNQPQWRCTHEGCGWTGTYADSFLHVEETGHGTEPAGAPAASAAREAAPSTTWVCTHVEAFDEAQPEREHRSCSWRGGYHEALAHQEATGHGVAPEGAPAPPPRGSSAAGDRVRWTDGASVEVERGDSSEG